MQLETDRLLLAVCPANLKMAAAAFARLPLQLPMIRTAYRTATGR